MERYTGTINFSYDHTDKINLIGGGELYHDRAWVTNKSKTDNYFNNGADRRVNYDNYTLYTQGLMNLPLANFTLGARYEHHSQFGSSFVPRAAVTKLINKFHFKLLFSQSFRSPGIENISLSNQQKIKPEKTTVEEFETGYQLNDKMFITANVFYITIKHPIVFSYDAGELYVNGDRTGTKGFEIEYRLKESWGYGDINYSYYRPNQNRVESYTVPGKNILLAFPSHKVTFTSSAKVYTGIYINPSVIFFSTRYGYPKVDANDNPLLKKYKPTLLVNINGAYKNFLVEKLDVSLGVFDLLGANYKFIQPYNSGHSPLPGPTREIVLKLTYNM